MDGVQSVEGKEYDLQNFLSTLNNISFNHPAFPVLVKDFFLLNL